MCFSATASFTASALLTTAGVVSIASAKDRSALPLSSIPLIFGLQQGLEGIVWLTTPGDPLYYIGMYGFLFCAYAVWPVLVPWSIFIYERPMGRNLPLLAIASIGTFVGTYFLSQLLLGGVTAKMLENSICYSFWPTYWYGIGLCYIFVVVSSGLFALERLLQLFGLGLAASFLLARYITDHSYPSAWCFFCGVFKYGYCRTNR
jgi:hypothetical protein